MITKDLLGHAKFDTTERYYNRARALEASRMHQSVIAELRREAVRRESGARLVGGSSQGTVTESPVVDKETL